jgi:NDP-sugar pyrophosphorylase family protein
MVRIMESLRLDFSLVYKKTLNSGPLRGKKFEGSWYDVGTAKVGRKTGEGSHIFI